MAAANSGSVGRGKLTTPRDLEGIKDIIQKVAYKDYRIVLRMEDWRPYLQVQFEAPDMHTGVVETQYCRKWMISFYMTDTEIVRTAYKAVLAAVEHEVGEFFTFGGEPVFRPHMDVYALHSLSVRNKVDKRN